MKNKHFIAIALLLLTLPTLAQATHYNKLEIKQNEVFEVDRGNTLLLDTLIMQDGSTIRFSSDTLGTLKANVALIGKRCTISSKGEDGHNYARRYNSYQEEVGSPGKDAGDLNLELHFTALVSLTIDTRGGTGGDGLRGRDGITGSPDRMEKQKIQGANGKYITVNVPIPGTPGTNGTDATTGLSGGDGGNIHFIYSAREFIPVFNNAKAKNSIILLYTGGKAGKDGKPGKGGYQSRDGNLITLDKRESVDGEIKLVNLTTTVKN